MAGGRGWQGAVVTTYFILDPVMSSTGLCASLGNAGQLWLVGGANSFLNTSQRPASVLLPLMH